jgi:predicted ATPase/transcriptional regulator with XRE-family HTH domain
MEQNVRSGSPGFGTLLRRYRLAAGLSQEALAERARMSIEGISALERGFRRSPQRETLELLAGALALDAEQRRDFEVAARTAVTRRQRNASVTVGPWPQTGTVGLPLALTTYVGRESDMDAIAKLLHEWRLVTLTGSGGVGKTRAALQAAHALGTDWEYPPRFVSLVSAVDAFMVTQNVAAAFGLQEVPNHALRETLLSNLSGKAALLILDNCEHVIDAAAQLAEALLASCPRVRILATSREPLHVAGEHAYRLPSLAVPSPKELRELSAAAILDYGAIALFCDRASALNHRFELTDAQVPIVAELCRHLDGIPLAIELAAARANTLSVQALTDRLGERFRLLAGGDRTALPRQQTMRAAIDWSYDMLSPPEQRIFERLSVFAGGCTLPEATQICGDEDAQEADVLDRLSTLADKSLVVADLDAAETRYGMLESFRQYAREKLAARGELEALSRRHALVYLELARALDAAAEANGDTLYRPTTGSELENWRAALNWSLVARNDVRLGQDLAAALDWFWHTFAPIEGRRWLQAAAQEIDEGTPAGILARLSYAQANIALLVGSETEQLAHAEAALAHYRALDDALGIAQAQSRVGSILIWTEQIQEGTAVLHEALAAARRLKNGRLTAFVLRALGMASVQNHDYPTARRYAAEAVEALEAMGATLTAAVVADLADYEFAAGNPELAVQRAAAQLAILREANMAPHTIASRLKTLACYLNALDRYEEAERCARESLDLACEHELEYIAVRALQRLAATAALRAQTATEGSRDTWTRAAHILGFARVRSIALHIEPTLLEQQELDRVLAVLRNAIGEAAVAEATQVGERMSQEQAIDEACVT